MTVTVALLSLLSIVAVAHSSPSEQKRTQRGGLLAKSLQSVNLAASSTVLPPHGPVNPKTDTVALATPDQSIVWPRERVAGEPETPLRRSSGSRCLTEAALASAIEESDRTGSYAFLVWRRGAVEVERYGPGFTSEGRAESASMHKTVLALAVGGAVADGHIPSVDEPIGRWLLEWSGDRRGQITVKQLLQMTSGLAPLSFDPTRPNQSEPRKPSAGIMATVLGLPLSDKPGSLFQYSSQVSQLLGVVLERATGERYASYLSRRIWRRIGASDAFVTLDRPEGRARTNSSFFARPEDWLRVGILVLNGGLYEGREVLPRSWISAMAAPSPRNPNYGYHIWRGTPHVPLRRYNRALDVSIPAREPFSADDVLFLDGGGGQRLYIIRSERLLILRIGPRTSSWDDSRIPNLLIRASRHCRGQ